MGHFISNLQFERLKYKNPKLFEKLGEFLKLHNPEKLTVDEINTEIDKFLENRLHQGTSSGNLELLAEKFTNNRAGIGISDTICTAIKKIVSSISDKFQKNFSTKEEIEERRKKAKRNLLLYGLGTVGLTGLAVYLHHKASPTPVIETKITRTGRPLTEEEIREKAKDMMDKFKNKSKVSTVNKDVVEDVVDKASKLKEEMSEEELGKVLKEMVSDEDIENIVSPNVRAQLKKAKQNLDSTIKSLEEAKKNEPNNKSKIGALEKLVKKFDAEYHNLILGNLNFQ